MGRDDGSEVKPFLRVRNISKSFPGVRAISEVSLDIALGEVRALTGENGSGKSTLAKVIGGLAQPDSGTIEVEGETVNLRDTAAAERLGIVTITQELTLAPHLTVAENICLGRLPTGRMGLVDWRTCGATARKALERLGIPVGEWEVVRDLPIELQQGVEIARALSRSPRLLVLDEATSSLSEVAAQKLLSIVEELRDQGSAVLMITHRMPEIYRAASNATVLRDGVLIDTVRLPDTDERQLVGLMVGRDIGDYYGRRLEPVGAEVLLRLRGFASLDGALKETSLELFHGEILGVAGLVGSGSAELAKALAGAIPSSGTIEVAGNPVRDRTPHGALAAGIGYVPDDRKAAALLPARSVAENFALAWLSSLSEFGFVSRRKAERRARVATRRYGVKAARQSLPISQLSGGNQQKVIIGRTFDRDTCHVFVLHDPTRGIDVAAKSELYELMRQKVADGAGVIVVSSELPELLGIADRIVVFHRGSIRAEFRTTEVDEATLAEFAVSGVGYDGVGTFDMQDSSTTPNRERSSGD